MRIKKAGTETLNLESTHFFFGRLPLVLLPLLFTSKHFHDLDNFQAQYGVDAGHTTRYCQGFADIEGSGIRAFLYYTRQPVASQIISGMV